MKNFILMIQFLTRIPIPIELDVKEEDFLEGIIYFPLIGLIIGMFIAAFYFIGYELGGIFLGSIMAVVSEVFITGGLHLDGLGDTFDGIYSNRSKEKILEIMKDSRLGTNGALAIFLTLILKFGFLYSINGKMIYPVLLLMPVYSKLCVVYGARFSHYARKSGMGNLLIGKVNNKHLTIGIFITFILSFIHIWSLPFILIGYIFTIYYIKHITKKIGGMTGDTLGALCELSEMVYLFYFIILFYVSR